VLSSKYREDGRIIFLLNLGNHHPTDDNLYEKLISWTNQIVCLKPNFVDIRLLRKGFLAETVPHVSFSD
jgi:hypothetical protein